MWKFIFVIFFLSIYELAVSQPQVQWVKRFGSQGWDVPHIVKSDNLGNIYVTGVFDGMNTAYCATIKYNYNGDSIWSRKFLAPDVGNTAGSQLFFDDSLNLYISGRYILKYSQQGDLLYSRYYGCSTYEMSFDRTGNIVYAGKDQRVAAGLVLLKCNRSGDSLWRQTYPPPVGYTDVTRIAVDKNNNIIVTGDYYTGSTYDYITTKFDANGNVIWYKTYHGGNADADDYPAVVMVDSLNNIIVTGTSAHSSGADNFLTLKYSSSGNVIWEQRHPAGGSGSEDMKLDKAGNIYICGITGVTKYATLKYDSAGSLQWFQQVSGVGFPPSNVLTLDTLGNVYMACNLNNSQGYSGYQVLKYTNAGNPVWNVFYPTTGIHSHYSTAIEVDKQGNVFVTGEGDFSTSYDYITIKIDQLIGVSPNETILANNFILYQNYPNPFNPSTKINYELQITNYVTLNVYDVKGRLVKELVNEKQSAGSYSIDFDGSELPSGTYICRLQAGDFSETKKMVLLK